MAEFLNILGIKRSLRARVRDASIEDVRKFHANLTEILAEREEQHEVEMQAEKEKLEKIEKIREMLDAEGISVEDLNAHLGGASSQPVKSKTKRPVKYSLPIEGKEDKTWTGQGKMPNEFQEFLDNGGKLENLLVDKKK